MKRVLIVSYAFPPRNVVGAIRPLKFARYLPDFGWRPIVLTVRKGAGWAGGTDRAMLEQLPSEVRIVRTPSIEPPYRMVSGLAGGDPRQPSPFSKRLLQALRTVILIPDDKIGWLPFALWEGWRILRQEQIDLIFATSPPPSALVAAAVLSRWTRRPLVVDFRDPWTQFTLHQWLRNPFRRRAEEAMEHAVLRQASRAITVTPPRTRALADKYPDIPTSRFATLTNGFDLADYHGPPDSSAGDGRFTVVYTGSFYYHRQPHTFLGVLRDLLEERPALRQELRVIFAGAGGEALGRLLSTYGLADVVTSSGYLPHRESLALQRRADALLLFLGDSPMASSWYPAKVFEYLAAGRPILALTPGGITADLVREAGTGIVVPPEDASAVRQALLDLYLRWQEGRLPALTDPAFPMRFEYRALTEQLARLFEAVLAERAGGGR